MKGTLRTLLTAAMILTATLFPGIAAIAQTPDAFTCPVTLPNNVDAPGTLDHYAADGHTWFEDGIWITIPQDGVLNIGPMQQMEPDDSEYPDWGFEKLMALQGEDVRGFIDITGQRLDQPSKETPDNDTTVDANYGSTGFVPIALMIPSAGCWEITATAGDSSATWVLDVRFVDRPIATPSAFACPVTLPNTDELMGLPSFPGEGQVYNEDDLWIAIPANGVLEFQPGNRSYSADIDFAGWMEFKLHVHRGNNASGTVGITGQRLDSTTNIHTVSTPGVAEYYGDLGFVPVTLVVPEGGCWEFTATAGDSSATWVVDVRIMNERVATPTS